MISAPVAQRPKRGAAWAVVLFAAVTVAGVYYAKWSPYYAKAFVAAAHHSLGASMVTGRAAAPPGFGWAAAWSYTVAYVKSIWVALAVGLLVGSGVQALLPRDWWLRVFGGGGYRSTALAGLAAVPSMMCTCCSAPVAVGMAKSQTSVSATLAYWLGNPILNPATMIFMGFVLGWNWVVLRLVVGLLLVFGVAHLAGRSVSERDLPRAAVAARQAAFDGTEFDAPILGRWLRALGQLCVGLLPEYAVIVLVLGAVRAWLFPAITPADGTGLWLLLGLAVAGTLFVVPTAGEIPIVQTLMGFGLGAGPAGALLTTLPAVSLPSLAMLSRAVPARALAVVTVSVAVLGVLSGLGAIALHL